LKERGGIEVTGRWGRRRRRLPDDFKERRGYSHVKEETLNRTMWRARFGRGFGPVVRQTTEWMNEFLVPYSWYQSVKYNNSVLCRTVMLINGMRTWCRAYPGQPTYLTTDDTFYAPLPESFRSW
jgi:hypothetical protein